MRDVFQRESAAFEVPLYDQPDWDVVRKLVDLLEPVRSKLETVTFTIEAKDARGKYQGASVDDLAAKAARRDERVEDVVLHLSGYEAQTETFLTAWIRLGRDISGFQFESGDEATVGHLAERTRAIVGRVSEQRGAVVGAGGFEPPARVVGAGGFEPPAPVVGAGVVERPSAVEPPRRPGWLHDPNPWLLVIVGTAIASIIATIILAHVL